MKIVERVERLDVPKSLAIALSTMMAAFHGYQHESELAKAINRHGILQFDAKTYEKRRKGLEQFWSKHARKLTPSQILGLVVEVLLGDSRYSHWTTPKFSRPLMKAAQLHKIDLNALHREERRKLEAAEKEKAQKKAAKRKGASRTKKASAKK